jgi:hypothetical protein
MKTQGTRIALGLRAWFVAEVLFGVGAVIAVGIDPAGTRTNFAWNLQPVVMAAVLGAYYFASAPLFVLPLLARRWEMIRVMILPTALFSTAELIATFLHWSSFSTNSLPFGVWLVSYLLPPPIFVGFYLWQQRRAASSAAAAPTEALGRDVQTALQHWGILLGVLAVVVFIFPDVLIGSAPWKMTPLSVRALDSWFIGLAAILLSVAHENDRTRVVLASPVLILLFPGITLQIARFADQVQFASPALFIGYGIILVTMAFGVYLARGNWRQALS